jgi:2-oxoglutarate ferredoxin oxidoreductase subunit alpha
MKNGLHMVESNEHDEKGYRNEDPENRVKMMNKRMNKLKIASKGMIPPKMWGKRDAEIGILGFGSTLEPIREALLQLEKKKIRTKYLQMRTLWPFPSRKVEEFVAACRVVFVVENNFSGQLADLVKSRIQLPFEARRIVKYSGRSFRPQEISRQIQEAL